MALPQPVPEDDELAQPQRDDDALRAEDARMEADRARFAAARAQAEQDETAARERESARAFEELAETTTEGVEAEEEQAEEEPELAAEIEQDVESAGAEQQATGRTPADAPAPQEDGAQEGAAQDAAPQAAAPAPAGGPDQPPTEEPADGQPPQQDPTTHEPGGIQGQGGAPATGDGAPGQDERTKARAERIAGGGAAAAAGAGGAPSLDSALSGGSVVDKLLDPELMKKLNLTPQQQQAVKNAAHVAEGAVAVGKMVESGAVTPSNIKKTVGGIKALRSAAKGEGGIKDLMDAAPQAGKALQEYAKKMLKEELEALAKMTLELILLILLIVLFIVVVLFAAVTGGTSISSTDGTVDEDASQYANMPMAYAPTGAVAMSSGLQQSEASQLVGLTTEVLRTLNTCGEVAPVVVALGAGGVPGSPRYDGRSVSLSTQGMPADTVRDLTACLAGTADPCIEELLGPDPSTCVSPVATPSCEQQRQAQVSSTRGELLLTLRRSCVPSSQQEPPPDGG